MAVVDDKTPRLGLLLPFTDNFLQDDVERLRDTFGLLDVLVVTRDKTTGKIADDMLSSVIAKLDAQGKLLTAQIPSSVVQKGPDGKIDASLMPSIAVVDTFPVPNEASMLGLQCERGDIAIREDLGKTFILTQMPPSVLSNWRELTSTNVTSVNGQTGAITGLAKSGVNNDITGLNALSGPLRLGGDAGNPYDAVTLRQLQAAAGGSGGASMNGVMNNFIGCVEWFNGSRAKLPAGYVPADGQVLSQVTYPDIWAAVSSQMLNAVTEALWNTTTSNARGSFYYNRGSYSTGGAAGTSPGSVTPDAWFRVPDLNGGQTGTGSIANTFLNGSAPSLSANVGQLRESAAPNIAGTIAYIGYQTNASDVNGPFTSTNTGSGAGVTTSGTGNNAVRLTSTNFNASNADKVYSGNAGELHPNTAVGIWIIRVAGTFSAQNTTFSVITGDTALPKNNTVVRGGAVQSIYQVAGVDRITATLTAKETVGGNQVVELSLKNSTATKRWTLPLVEGELVQTTDTRLGTINNKSGGTLSTGHGIAILSNPFGNPSSGNYLNGVGLNSLLNGRGGLADTRGALFGLSIGENVGTTAYGMLTFSGFNSTQYWRFNQNGTLESPGAYLNNSDKRLKTKIEKVTNPLEKIMMVNGVTWDCLNGKHSGQGFIAQEIQDIFPNAVSVGGESTLNDGSVIKDTLSLDLSGVSASLHHEGIKALIDLVEMALTDPQNALEKISMLKKISALKKLS